MTYLVGVLFNESLATERPGNKQMNNSPATRRGPWGCYRTRGVRVFVGSRWEIAREDVCN